MADSIRKLVESQDKRWKQGIAEDKKRDEMFLKFKEDEAAKNRQHELAMAQIFAAAFSQSKPQETVSIAQREVPITPSSSTPYQTPGRFQRAPTGPYTSFLRQPFRVKDTLMLGVEYTKTWAGMGEMLHQNYFDIRSKV